MLLFRSEEHVTRWIEERRSAIGATLTPQQGWRLATAWFEDRALVVLIVGIIIVAALVALVVPG